jgi:hypothetical protein
MDRCSVYPVADQEPPAQPTASPEVAGTDWLAAQMPICANFTGSIGAANQHRMSLGDMDAVIMQVAVVSNPRPLSLSRAFTFSLVR